MNISRAGTIKGIVGSVREIRVDWDYLTRKFQRISPPRIPSLPPYYLL
jgi:hypothetical protein